MTDCAVKEAGFEGATKARPDDGRRREAIQCVDGRLMSAGAGHLRLDVQCAVSGAGEVQIGRIRENALQRLKEGGGRGPRRNGSNGRLGVSAGRVGWCRRLLAP